MPSRLRIAEPAAELACRCRISVSESEPLKNEETYALDAVAALNGTGAAVGGSDERGEREKDSSSDAGEHGED